MKGLEITELRLSDLWTENPTGRFDSECFQKVYLKNIVTIERFPSGWMRLGDAISELTGGATPLGADYPESGVRFLRVQNVMQNFIDDSDLTFISPSDDNALSRSRLKTDDVLLTITGVSYGKSAVVTPEFVGSNINQHSVRIELQPGTFEPFFVSTFLNSNPGKLQSDQNITGVTRPALDYDTIWRFRIPRVSTALQTAIARLVRDGQQQFVKAKQTLAEAKEVLLAALGLGGWQPPEPLTYTRRASEAFAANRCDAEHFRPKFLALVNKMKKHGRVMRLGDCLRFCERGRQPDYAEQGLVVINSRHVRTDAVVTDAENRFGIEDPSQLKLAEENRLTIKYGDVLINGTGVGTMGRSAAYLKTERALPDNHVTILRASPEVGLDPVFLSVQLNSIIGQMQVEQYFKGSSGQIELYPTEIKEFQIWLPPEKIQLQIRQHIESANTARQRAHELLAAAQRAVEIAIEDSEPAALAYLKKQGV